MKELNHNTLQHALQRLPEYEPPAGLWGVLEEALDAEEMLGESVRALSTYEPPAQVWENLEAALEQKTAAKPALRVAIFRRVIAAAAVGLVLLSAWWFFKTENSSGEQIVVSQEKLDEQIRASVQEKEDAAFELVQTLCQSRAPVCEQPEFKTLKSELDELTEAKESLRQALGEYGDDPTLATQLVRIERERSGVLRQMMSMI
ncbi:MAG: hypothetical protein DYG98_07860 [Haliscomenobacteraceae bacterium CHB4]|nr:hypothetical protein [Saprospiraceae bacterium]MCE7922958.1 hypothetical protein [Haliscomenobacteraceae bacterium CHB4]